MITTAALPLPTSHAAGLAITALPDMESPEIRGFEQMLAAMAGTGNAAPSPGVPVMAAASADGTLPVSGNILPPALPDTAPGDDSEMPLDAAEAVATLPEPLPFLSVTLPVTLPVAVPNDQVSETARQSAAPLAPAPAPIEASPQPVNAPALRVRPDAQAAQAAVFLAPQHIGAEREVRVRPVLAEPAVMAEALPLSSAAEPALVPAFAPPAAAPVTHAAPAAAPRTEAPQDFAALVDRLVQARDAAMTQSGPQTVQAAIAHADFGQVSLRFDQGERGLSVSMASADPDFARAAQAAIPPTPAATATFSNDTGSSTGRHDATGQGSSQSQARNGSSDGQRAPVPRPSASADRGGGESARSGIFA